jgi:hypothetical protein
MEGWLVVFNRKLNKDWTKEVIWGKNFSPDGQKIYITRH